MSEEEFLELVQGLQMSTEWDDPCPICGIVPASGAEALRHLLDNHRREMMSQGVDIEAAIEALLELVSGPPSHIFVTSPSGAQDALFLLETNEIRYETMKEIAGDFERAAGLIATLLSSLKVVLKVLEATNGDTSGYDKLRSVLLECAHNEDVAEAQAAIQKRQP